MVQDFSISIVIPAFNVERCIHKTLNSLIAQTVKDFEIIIVDDGSTDNTYRTAKNFLLNSGFRNYTLLRKPNGGVSSARNAGIKEAKGGYIIFLDGDDYVAPQLIEKVEGIISKYKPDIVCWKHKSVGESGKKKIPQFPFKGLKEERIFTGFEVLEKVLIEKSYWICTGSAAYLRNMLVVNDLEYDENHQYGEDQEFIFRCLAESKEVYFIDDVLTYYVKRGGSASHSVHNKYLDAYLSIMGARRYIYKKVSELKKNQGQNLLKAIEEHAIIHFPVLLNKYILNLKWPSYKEIVKIINRLYPNLLEQVLVRVRTEKVIISNVKARDKIRLGIFRLFPRLYVFIYWAYGKLFMRDKNR